MTIDRQKKLEAILMHPIVSRAMIASPGQPEINSLDCVQPLVVLREQRRAGNRGRRNFREEAAAYPDVYRSGNWHEAGLAAPSAGKHKLSEGFAADGLRRSIGSRDFSQLPADLQDAILTWINL